MKKAILGLIILVIFSHITFKNIREQELEARAHNEALKTRVETLKKEFAELERKINDLEEIEWTDTHQALKDNPELTQRLLKGVGE